VSEEHLDISWIDPGRLYRSDERLGVMLGELQLLAARKAGIL
jgi:hypothetical protein